MSFSNPATHLENEWLLLFLVFLTAAFMIHILKVCGFFFFLTTAFQTMNCNPIWNHITECKGHKKFVNFWKRCDQILSQKYPRPLNCNFIIHWSFGFEHTVAGFALHKFSKHWASNPSSTNTVLNSSAQVGDYGVMNYSLFPAHTVFCSYRNILV